MPIPLTQRLIEQLRVRGVTTLHGPGSALPDDTEFEPPCSFKWMTIQHSLRMGAFSYGVSGFYFGCRIGRYCSFGEAVQAGRHPHPMHWFSSSPFFYQPYADVLDQPLPSTHTLTPVRDFKRRSPPVVARTTHIGNDVWIGHGAFLLPGITVGDGAVIAAMAVVTKDVPPYAVVAGSPAKVIRYRFTATHIERLSASRWWQYAPWQLKGARVDDIGAFLDLVSSLRDSGIEPYRTDWVRPGALA